MIKINPLVKTQCLFEIVNLRVLNRTKWLLLLFFFLNKNICIKPNKETIETGKLSASWDPRQKDRMKLKRPTILFDLRPSSFFIFAFFLSYFLVLYISSLLLYQKLLTIRNLKISIKQKSWLPKIWWFFFEQKSLRLLVVKRRNKAKIMIIKYLI